MPRPRRLVPLAVLFLAALPALAQDVAEVDSLHVIELLAAESSVDSLRAEIRRLDRNLQTMKQNFAEAGDVDLLLEALAGEEPDEGAVPEDTRSRRQRVDTLLRAITQRPGQLRFNGGATVVAQDLLGGDADGSAGTGSFDLYAHTSFGPSTLLFFAFEAAGGEGLDGLLPLAAPVNGDAASTRGADGFDQLVLNEAWAEFGALEDAVTLTVGKIDLTNYFDINGVANDETSQFLAGAFVNSAALLAPDPGPGLRARTVLLHRFSVQAGVVSADSTGGTRFRDAFVIGSAGMRISPDSDYEGNLRVYWYSPPESGDAAGWGLSLDQEAGRRVTLFGRYGRNDAALALDAAARRAWSAGLQWERPVGRRVFRAAAAYGEARSGRGALVSTFEAYASWQVNTWTHVSPHVQRVKDPAWSSAATTLAGLRVQFNF